MTADAKDVVVDAARKLARAEESDSPRWARYEALRRLCEALAALDAGEEQEGCEHRSRARHG